MADTNLITGRHTTGNSVAPGANRLYPYRPPDRALLLWALDNNSAASNAAAANLFNAPAMANILAWVFLRRSQADIMFLFYVAENYPEAVSRYGPYIAEETAHGFPPAGMSWAEWAKAVSRAAMDYPEPRAAEPAREPAAAVAREPAAAITGRPVSDAPTPPAQNTAALAENTSATPTAAVAAVEMPVEPAGGGDTGAGDTGEPEPAKTEPEPTGGNIPWGAAGIVNLFAGAPRLRPRGVTGGGAFPKRRRDKGPGLF